MGTHSSSQAWVSSEFPFLLPRMQIPLLLAVFRSKSILHQTILAFHHHLAGTNNTRLGFRIFLECYRVYSRPKRVSHRGTLQHCGNPLRDDP
jgi:hypothetical protein